MCTKINNVPFIHDVPFRHILDIFLFTLELIYRYSKIQLRLTLSATHCVKIVNLYILIKFTVCCYHLYLLFNKSEQNFMLINNSQRGRLSI